MKILPLFTAFLVLVTAARAGHRFLCTDSYGNKIAVVSADGAVEWEVSYQHPQDCWALPNGNYLFCHARGAIEMDPLWSLLDTTPGGRGTNWYPSLTY